MRISEGLIPLIVRRCAVLGVGARSTSSCKSVLGIHRGGSESQIRLASQSGRNNDRLPRLIRIGESTRASHLCLAIRRIHKPDGPSVMHARQVRGCGPRHKDSSHFTSSNVGQTYQKSVAVETTGRLNFLAAQMAAVERCTSCTT